MEPSTQLRRLVSLLGFRRECETLLFQQALGWYCFIFSGDYIAFLYGACVISSLWLRTAPGMGQCLWGKGWKSFHSQTPAPWPWSISPPPHLLSSEWWHPATDLAVCSHATRCQTFYEKSWLAFETFRKLWMSYLQVHHLGKMECSHCPCVSSHDWLCLQHPYFQPAYLLYHTAKGTNSFALFLNKGISFCSGFTTLFLNQWFNFSSSEAFASALQCDCGLLPLFLQFSLTHIQC